MPALGFEIAALRTAGADAFRFGRGAAGSKNRRAGQGNCGDGNGCKELNGSHVPSKLFKYIRDPLRGHKDTTSRGQADKKAEGLRTLDFVMNVKFFDLQDQQNPLNGSMISQASELLELLSRLQRRPPFFCKLIGENGYELLLGIGGPRGCVQHSSVDGSPPYLMVVTEESECLKEDFEFLISGELTPVSSRYCAPFKTVSEIAVYFQRTGERNSTALWEEVGPPQ